MSKKLASKEAVHAAADGLKARGINPTYDKIIEVLGGGSNSTVGPHLETWNQSSQPPSRPIPELIQSRAKILFEAVWAAALGATQQDIDSARQESSVRLEQAENALAASIKIGQGLEVDRDRLQEEVALLSAQCTEFKFQLREAESLKSDLEAAECLASKRREECEALTRQLFALQCVNDTLKAHGQQLLEKVGRRTVGSRKRNAPA